VETTGKASYAPEDLLELYFIKSHDPLHRLIIVSTSAQATNFLMRAMDEVLIASASDERA